MDALFNLLSADGGLAPTIALASMIGFAIAVLL
jgi:hypothetical protein